MNHKNIKLFILRISDYQTDLKKLYNFYQGISNKIQENILEEAINMDNNLENIFDDKSLDLNMNLNSEHDFFSN